MSCHNPDEKVFNIRVIMILAVIAAILFTLSHFTGLSVFNYAFTAVGVITVIFISVRVGLRV